MITTVAAVGCGLMAGVFLAFSLGVMPGLRRLPAPQGIAAMQAANIAIVNPLFLLLYLGTPVACVAAAVVSGGEAWRVAGAALYVVGAFIVTSGINVPLNNVLAPVDPADPAGEPVWQRYLSRWTAWNHVRAVAATAACAVLAAAPAG